MPNELKPCPFCGCKTVRLNRCCSFKEIKIRYVIIECGKCGIFIKRANEERAIEAWNRRSGEE